MYMVAGVHVCLMGVIDYEWNDMEDENDMQVIFIPASRNIIHVNLY